MAERKVPQAATDRLREELERYVEARIQMALEGVGHRLGSGARRLSETRLGPRALADNVAERGRALRGHLPSGGAVTSKAAQAKDTAAHAKDAVLDRAKGVTARRPAPGEDMGKGMTVIEDIDVGVPVPDAYDEWRQFQESDQFAKGIQRGEGSITEEVRDERIAWTSEMDHATAKGVVTFHPLGENLTKVLLVLRYFPKGPVERAESLLRVQGRRARRDLKRYRTFVMMQGHEEHEQQDENDEADEADEKDRDERGQQVDDDENEDAEDAYEDDADYGRYGHHDEDDREEPEVGSSRDDDWEEDEDEDDDLERDDRYDDRQGPP
ncbi:putative membrane protein [Streptomyces sp. SAI-170]|uniref:SRPBCC family protein n=1 Tax=Streptomyces sp. SAI-170 TaxID=3377729 RepID=UPI003C7A069E